MSLCNQVPRTPGGKQMTRKLYITLMLLIALVPVLAACGDAATPSTAQPTNTTAAGGTDAPTAGAQAGGQAAGQPFTIGISNPFISSEYRTQMIQELID